MLSGIPLDGVAPNIAPESPGDSPDEPPPGLSFQVTDWSTNRYLGEPPARQWLIDKVLPAAVSGIFASLGGVGKSFTLLDLAFKVTRFDSEAWTSPRALGGEIVRFGSAVVLSAEDSRDELHRRVQALGDDETLKRATGRLFVPPVVDLGGAPTLMNSQFGEANMTPAWFDFVDQCKAIPDLQLVIIDPLQPFISIDLNSDSTAAARLMAALSSLASETGATVIGSHHMRKASFEIKSIWQAREAVRGVASLLDQARWCYTFWYGSESDLEVVEQQLMNEGVVDEGLNRADFVQGAIVKSNSPTDQTIRDYVRSESGLLVDRTGDFEMAREVSNTISNANRDAIFEDIIEREKENNHFVLAAQSKDSLAKHITKNYGYKLRVVRHAIDKWFDEGLLHRFRDKHRKAQVVTVKRLPETP